MDSLAMVGAWVLSAGSNNSAMVVLGQDQLVQPPPERHTWTVYEQESADRLFATPVQTEEASLAQALLVTTLGLATLKGVVLDEEKEDEEAKAKEKRLKLEHKCGGCC